MRYKSSYLLIFLTLFLSSTQLTVATEIEKKKKN